MGQRLKDHLPQRLVVMAKTILPEWRFGRRIAPGIVVL